MIQSEINEDPVSRYKPNQKKGEARPNTKPKPKSPSSLKNTDLSMLLSNLSFIVQKQSGVFAPIYLLAAGFEYTGDGDTARCKNCGLEISNWTSNMNPYNIHSEQKPDCPFIQSIIKSSLSKYLPCSSSTTVVPKTSASNEHGDSRKGKKIETTGLRSLSDSFIEVNLIQEVRTRTFSHWPHDEILPSKQMIEAGFFFCNVGDRVMCIYCNLICQQWAPRTDDPCEVHRTLSPSCIYARTKLMRHEVLRTMADCERSTRVTTDNHLQITYSLDEWGHVFAPPVTSSNYNEIPERLASFSTWPHENLPSIDDLVRAGFFYTGKNSIVTCFYCNGPLQNWGPTDNPMIEHARWFPHCAYAKQLCGDNLYQKIQEAQRASQEHVTVNESGRTRSSYYKFNTYLTTSIGPLIIPDEETLSMFMAARLDLPISQRLLDQNFKLIILNRCWKDQLRLKQNDFVSDCDLYIACEILKKQIEHIDGNKENIVIPSIRMKQIRKQNTVRVPQERLTRSNTTHPMSNSLGVDRPTSTQSSINGTTPPTVDDQINELIQYHSIHEFFE